MKGLYKIHLKISHQNNLVKLRSNDLVKHFTKENIEVLDIRKEVSLVYTCVNDRNRPYHPVSMKHIELQHLTNGL